MKRSLIFKNLVAVLLVSSVTFLASCVKNRNDGAVDFSQLAPIVQIPEGGLKNFSASALVFDATHTSDTGYFRVNYAATTVAPSDIVVTLAVDDAARTAYNASHTDQYEKAPDSIFKFTTTSVTVKAGQSYTEDEIKLTVYPNKVDQSKSYMIAITITNASGVNISGNFGTIYYHLIGNPLAGDYNVLFTRWNYTGAVVWAGPAAGLGLAVAPLDANHVAQPASNPPAAAVAFYGETGVPNPTYPLGYPVWSFAPVTDHIVTGYIGNVPEPGASTGANYFITANSNFSAITFDFAPLWYNNPATGGGYSNTARYVRGYVPPTPTQKPAFRLITQYNNALAGAGNDRIVDETFRHR